MQNFLTSGSQYSTDVVFNKKGEIEASRFVFQAQNLTTIDDTKSIMIALRHVFANELKDYNLTSYHMFYMLGEQVSRQC